VGAGCDEFDDAGFYGEIVNPVDNNADLTFNNLYENSGNGFSFNAYNGLDGQAEIFNLDFANGADFKSRPIKTTGTITGNKIKGTIITGTSSTAIGDSIIYQSGSGAIGIGTSAPVNSVSTSTEKRLTIKGSSYGSLYLQAGTTNFRWWASTSGLFLTNVVTSTDVIVVDSTNNYVGINNSSAAHALDVAGSIKASSNVYIGSNGVYLYAEDVASSSELKVADEAGNITTLSPHNFSLIPEGPSEDLAWSYYSENKGKKINVDMLKLARILEKLTGEKLVYIEE
jgi:hypothetical protein